MVKQQTVEYHITMEQWYTMLVTAFIFLTSITQMLSVQLGFISFVPYGRPYSISISRFIYILEKEKSPK